MAGGQVGAQVGDVLRLAGGVDHQVEVVAGVDHHQVVENAARLVGEDGVALPAFGEAHDIRRHQGLQRLGGRRAAQQQLPHVGDVEEAGGRAGMLVLLLDAQRVLHRHLVAGEGHQLGAELDVQIVEGSAVQFAHGESPVTAWKIGLPQA